MNPCRTALVGLLVISCALVQADISHLYNVGNMATNLPTGTPFWWMNDKSPFKRAILGCNGPNGCSAQSNQLAFAGALQPAGFTSQQQRIEGGYELNPFLNAGSKHGSINMYLPPVNDPVTTPCGGRDQVCVNRQNCGSGFILATNVPNSGLNRNCLAESEVCCRVQIPVTTTRAPPPPPTQVPSIPCNQPNFFCVPPQACNNGLILGQTNRLQSAARCFGNDVCCRYQPATTPAPVTTPRYIPPATTTPRYIPPQTTPRYIPPQTQRPVTTQRPYTTTFKGPDYIPPRVPDSSNNVPKVIYGGEEDKPFQIVPQACPAALNCTELQFCDAVGVISKTPVVLTKQQEQFRVPLTDCRDVRKNIVGKCCRDPDYVDPWPATILGQYNREIIGALFDDGSYKPPGASQQQRVQVNNQQQQRLQVNNQQQQQQQQRLQVNNQQQQQQQQQRIQSANQRLVIQQTSNDLVGSASGSCGIRNDNALPRGTAQFDTGFGEYTWQAMVLMQSNRSLLCGGAIIDDNTIATAAHCVHGVNPSDLKVKTGEWKLGTDDEPKPFQILGVRAVSFHPAYNPTNFNNDVALLHCDERIRYDTHVGPICLEDQVASASSTSQDCVTTGWGKEVLRIHLKGAIMNQVPMQELSQNECSSALSGYGYNGQTSTCCRAASQGGDACLADVGSALACRNGNGQYVLRGVYSTETECASPNQLVTFAKMDTQWIRQSLARPTGNTVSHHQHHQTSQTSQGSGFGHGNGNGHFTGQASQAIHQLLRQEVIAQPTAQHVYSVPSQAPLYLPPL